MTRTRPLPLVVVAISSFVIVIALQIGLGTLGYPRIVPALTLSVTLVLIAAIVVALALPVRRATRATPARRVDPFYATRVLLIAKASAVVGALLGGAALGMLAELAIRPVSTGGVVWSGVVMLVAAVGLLVAGLVAESFCAIPPRDDDDPAGSARA